MEKVPLGKNEIESTTRMEDKEENYIIQKRPFGEIIYVIKSIKIREMVDSANAFPYHNINKNDLIEYDLDTLKETDLTSFEQIEENSTDHEMSQINPEAEIEVIRETSLIGDGDVTENYGNYIRETNLAETDNRHRSNSDENSDPDQLNLDTAESVCLSTDSGIINDKTTPDFELDENLTLKFQCLESDLSETDCEDLNTSLVELKRSKKQQEDGLVKFQDIESDFFESDWEATDVETLASKLETNNGETRDMVKFQDIQSDFFETDCETMDEQVTSSNDQYTMKAQNIRSDFFDGPDRDEKITSSTPRKPKTKTKIEAEEDPQKEISNANTNLLTRLNKEKDKRVSMTTSLLRSTIDELERALTNSSTLLANRDQKVQDLRKRNTELKKSLTEELENNKQLKLLIIEKDSVVGEKDSKINSLQNELDQINKELSDLRLYKLNNIGGCKIPNYEPIRLDNSQETDIYDNKVHSNNFMRNSSSQGCPNTSSSSVANRSYSCSDETLKPQKLTCPLARSISEQHNTNSNGNSSSSGSISNLRCPKMIENETVVRTSLTAKSPTASTTSIKPKKDVDSVSSGELHARLQMKFMRDAFFYYMIGFHSDEQINAILAILNYGDKRQDFVLEAHKLKKRGKKFNVSKVSTRSLTFVEDVQDV